jgi:hypothetical protein
LDVPPDGIHPVEDHDLLFEGQPRDVIEHERTART